MAFMIASRSPVSTRISDDDAFPDDDRHGVLPGEAAGQDELEGDDRVQSEAGGQRERVVRRQAHRDGQDARRQRRRHGDRDERRSEPAAARRQDVGFTKMM
jgi:hypothetical protein